MGNAKIEIKFSHYESDEAVQYIANCILKSGHGICGSLSAVDALNIRSGGATFAKMLKSTRFREGRFGKKWNALEFSRWHKVMKYRLCWLKLEASGVCEYPRGLFLCFQKGE